MSLTHMQQMHVFWDVDNKEAIHTRAEDLMANMHAALQPFGEVAGMCAYGNTPHICLGPACGDGAPSGDVQKVSMMMPVVMNTCSASPPSYVDTSLLAA